MIRYIEVNCGEETCEVKSGHQCDLVRSRENPANPSGACYCSVFARTDWSGCPLPLSVLGEKHEREILCKELAKPLWKRKKKMPRD
jgi:hypothetical protein